MHPGSPEKIAGVIAARHLILVKLSDMKIMMQKSLCAALAALLLAALPARAFFGLDSVKQAAGEKVVSVLVLDTSGLKYEAAPAEVFQGLDVLCREAKNSETNLPCSLLEGFADFLAANARSGKAWALPQTNGVYGALSICVLTNTFRERLLFSSPAIPDHAVYDTVRHSAELDGRGAGIVSQMFTGAEGVLHRDWSLNFDQISPNDTTGAYYCYTNLRLYVQGKVGGRRMLVTGTVMHGPSDVSCKGTLIDEKIPGLFYYSGEKGLAFPGAGWMETKMEVYRAFTASVELESNVWAFANLSWLSAGWQGINVIRTHHIYAVLQSIIANLREYGGQRGLSTDRILSAVKENGALSEEAVEGAYSKYCEFCAEHAGSGMIGLKLGGFARLYDKAALAEVPPYLRRALVLQEKVRTLKGRPTWSAPEKKEN